MARLPRFISACLLTSCLIAPRAEARRAAIAAKAQRKVSMPAGAHGTPESKAAAPRSLPKTGAGKARAGEAIAARPAEPPLEGKIAVFLFAGEGENEEGAAPQLQGSLRRPVLALLRSKGLTPVTDLRTVDMPDQFRDMATALNLVAYVHGKVQSHRDKRRLTLFVRSGFSGRKGGALVTTVPAEGWNEALDEKLWKRLLPLMKRACAEAKRPRPRSRTLQINAGTPLEPVSPEDDADVPG
jgi:hypothetical protein